MDIHSDSYRVASLEDQRDAIEIIQYAETRIAQLTGNPVTLIAYEKSGSPES